MANRKTIKSGVRPFIRQEGAVAPFTTIQNRALVGSPLKAVFGNERVHVNSINKLLKETGPNGEPVFEADSGDSRVRFIGDWFGGFGSYGNYVNSNSPYTNNKIEITFYGTGLNLMILADANARDYNVIIDNGAPVAYNANGSNVLGNRNYKPNLLQNVAKGLTLGWHTIRTEYISGLSVLVSGFEIINESSDITVLSGKAYSNGYEYDIATNTVIPYKTDFDNVLDVNVGTKGGRSVLYIDPSDVTIKKRLTVVGTPLYLGAADHTNEKEYRNINWREYGRNRVDDFSTLTTASDRTFTLDDDTTTLVGSGLRANNGILDMPANATYLTISFVGTGLDVVRQDEGDGGTHTLEYFVDGSSIGTEVVASSSIQPRTFKVCSGLPYGSHTVKIVRNSAVAFTCGISDFIVYQPKKPVLPEGAIELAEYNIMADFVANTTAGAGTISTGVVRKASEREFVYSGTWLVQQIASLVNGTQLNGTTSGGYAERPFFGEGFDFRFRNDPTHGANSSISIDGLILNETNFTINGSGSGPAVTVSEYGTGSFNTTTGVLDQSGTAEEGGGLTVSGLPNTQHIFRWTNNVATQGIIGTLDIITPIHSPHTTFGSRSIKDLRNFDNDKSVNKVSKDEKVSITYNHFASTVYNSKGISQIINLTTQVSLVYFEDSFAGIPKGNIIGSAVGVDGVEYIRSVTNADAPPEHFGARAGTDNVPDSRYKVVEFTGALEKDELEE